MNTKKLLLTLAFPLTLAFADTANANVIFTVNLDTSAISGLGGYALAFSFQDGSLVGDSNNTATLSSFAFGGGSAGGPPVLAGGASGDISSTVTLTDSDFSNLFVEGFTPGTSLSFKIDLTTNVDLLTPDFFGLSVLLNGAPLPTLDDTLGDNLLYFNMDSSNPTPTAWATAPGSPIALDAPIVALAPPTGQVPEPDSLFLLTAGLASLLGARLTAKCGGRRNVLSGG